MSQFGFDKKTEGAATVIALRGNIDEDANFGNISLDGSKEVVLDLEQVAAINSCGIREWIKWIKTAAPESKFIYRKCPKVIVDQINMVSGFLPENGQVESFFVPYYSDASDTEKMVLFTSGKEFKGAEIFPPEEVKDDAKGNLMEMDVIEAKYFKFLKK